MADLSPPTPEEISQAAKYAPPTPDEVTKSAVAGMTPAERDVLRRQAEPALIAPMRSNLSAADQLANDALSARVQRKIDELPVTAAMQAQRDAADRQQDAQDMEYLAAHPEVTPEQASKARQLHIAKPQYDFSYIVKNLDRTQREAQAENMPWDLIAKDHPAMAKYLKDPATAAQTLQDSASLTGIHRAVGGSVSVLDKDGKLDTHYSAPPWALEIRDSFFQHGAALITGASKTLLGVNDEMAQELSKWGTPRWLADPEATAERRARMSDLYNYYMRESPGSKNYTGQIGGDVDYIKGGPGAWNKLGRVVEVAVGGAAKSSDLIAGSAFVGPASVLGFMTAYSGMDLAPKMEAASGSATKGLALTAAFAPLLGKVMSFNPLGNAVGARADSIINKAVTGAAAKALTSQSWGKLLRIGAVKLGEDALVGQLALGAQSATSAGAEQIAMVFGGKHTDPSAVARAAYDGFTDPSMWGMALFGTGRTLLGGVGQMYRAREQATRMEKLRDALLSAKTAEHDPALHEQQVHDIVNQPGLDPFFHLPLDRFNEVVEKAGGKPRDLAAKIYGDSGEAYDKATSEGASHLPIPVEKMRAVLTDTLLGDLAMNEGTLDLDVKSRAQAIKTSEEFQAGLEAGLKEPTDPKDKSFFDTLLAYTKGDKEAAQDLHSKISGFKAVHPEFTKEQLWNTLWGEQGIIDPTGEKPAPTVFDRNSLMKDFADKSGSLDLPAASAHVESEVAKALVENREVTLTIEGKARKITGVSPSGLTDAEGKPWGLMPVVSHLPGDHARLEIAPPEHNLEPLIRIAEKDSGLYNSKEWAEALPKDEKAPKVEAAPSAEEKDAQAVARQRLKQAIENGKRSMIIEERQKILAKAEESIKEDPGQRARHFFNENELWGTRPNKAEAGAEVPLDEANAIRMRDPATGEPLRLNRFEVESYGFKGDELGKGVVTSDSAKSMDLDMAANAMHFRGEDPVRSMLASLRDALPPGEWKRQWADAELKKTYGNDLLNNPQVLLKSIMDSVQNEKAVPTLLSRLRGLAESLDPVRLARSSMSPDAWRDLADRILQDKSLRDLKSDIYTRAGKAASERALKYLQKGDLGKAFDATEAQLLNHYLYRAARQAEGSLGAMFSELRDRATSEASQAVLGKADPAYRNFNNTLLDALGLVRHRQSPADSEGLQGLFDELGKEPEAPAEPRVPSEPGPNPLETFITRVKLNGQEGNLAMDQPGGWTKDVVAGVLSGYRQWKDLKPLEAKEVFNAIKNVQHIAKVQNEALKAARNADLNALLESAARHLGGVTPGQEGPGTQGTHKVPQVTKDKETAPNFLLQAWQDAYNETPRQILGMLSPEIKEHIDGAFLDHRIEERQLLHGLYEPWKETQKHWETDAAFHKNVPGLEKVLRLRDANNVPLDGGLPKSYLVQVVKWLGSASGREKALGALQVPPEAILDLARKVFTKADWEAIQAEHDFFDEHLLPLKAAAWERRTGLPFDKVEALGYKAHWIDPETGRDMERQMRGGYYPVHWDGRPGVDKQARQVSMEKDPTYRPAVGDGSFQSRTQFVGTPDFAWDNIPSHLLADIHNLAFGDFVQETNRVLLDPRMLAIIRRQLGPEYANWPRSWLERVAHDRDVSPVSGHLAGIGDAARLTRSQLVTGAIGLNLPIFAAHMTHPLATALLRDGPAMTVSYAAPAMSHVLEGMTAGLATGVDPVHEMVMSKSRYLPVYLDALRENMGRWYKGTYDVKYDTWTGKWDRFQDKAQMVGFWHLREMTSLVSKMIWKAKYDYGMSKHGMEDQAIHEADEQVRASMPNYNVMEAPSILAEKHGAIVSSLLIFHTFWAKYREMINEQKHDMVGKPFQAVMTGQGSAKDLAWGTAKFAGRAAAAITAGIVVGEFLKGQGPQQDEDPATWFARRALAAPLKLFPYSSDLFEGGVDSLVAGTKWRDIQVNNPYFAPMERALKAVQYAMDDRKSTDDTVAKTAEAVLMLAGLPSVSPVRALHYGYKVATGDETPRGPLDLMSGTIYGKKYGRAARYNTSTPLTLTQDFLDAGKGNE